MADARVRTDIVLARPGTRSSRTWPLASNPTNSRSTNCSWPTMTRPISARNLPTQPAVACTCSSNVVLMPRDCKRQALQTQAIHGGLSLGPREGTRPSGLCGPAHGGASVVVYNCIHVGLRSVILCFLIFLVILI